MFPDGDENQAIIGVMKVWGYFDASGTQENLDRLGRPSPAVSVSGYLATPKQWKQFDKEWKIVLDYAGIPFFHLTEFVAREGFYKGWSEEKRDLVYQAFLSVIYHNVIYGIGAVTLLADYREVVNTDRYRSAIGSPFTYCSKMCFFSGGEWARTHGYEDSIKYVFDDGDKHKKEVADAHNIASMDEELSEFYRFSIGSLTFEHKDKVRPIQAADILAHEMYKEMQRYLKHNDRQRYTRMSLQSLLEISGTYKVYAKDSLPSAVSSVDRSDRERQQSVRKFGSTPNS